MADIPNPNDLLDNLTQNDIDFLCKTFQIWHDFYFGDDNDDASLAQLQPFTCSFTGCCDTDVRAFGGTGVNLNGALQTKAHCLYSFAFDGYNAYYSGLQPIYAQSILNQTTEQGINNLAIYMAGCQAAANGSSLQSTRKGNIDYENDRCIDGCFNPSNYQKDYIYPCSYKILTDLQFNNTDWGFHLTAMQKYYNLFDTEYIYGDSSNVRTSTSNLVCLDFYNPSAYIDESATPQSGYYKNFGGLGWSNTYKGIPLRPFHGKGAFVTTGANVSQTFIDSLTQDTYTNNFEYTTNEGDTITVNYGDNYINIGGGGGGGVGGIGAGGIMLNYFDLENILDHLIDDLTINGNLTDGNGQPLQLTVPTFQEIKYGDYGDFYITPLEQIKKLPTAPDFETSMDVSDYPETLGTIIADTLSVADGIGIGLSSLLLGALFFSFLWNKLRG